MTYPPQGTMPSQSLGDCRQSTQVPESDIDRKTPLDLVLSRLTAASHCGDGFLARCPAHDDHAPSLTVAQASDGRVLLHCHAGCAPETVVARLGLRMADLFPVARTKASRLQVTLPGAPAAEPPDPIWRQRTLQYMDALTTELASELATQLGLSVGSLTALSVGWDTHTKQWAFPERDAQGHEIGILLRSRDGAKRLCGGGRRGLYLPFEWYLRPGPIYIVEGASDTAALVELGLCGLGRPSARGGINLLVASLSWMPADRTINVMGEHDARSDGTWPGREGAQEVARRLGGALRNEVSWALPPDGAKDLREWVVRQPGLGR